MPEAYYDETGLLVKVCSRCQKDAEELGMEADPLPAHQSFYKSSSTKDGFQSWCKPCMGNKMRNWYQANKKRLKEQRDANKREPLPERVEDYIDEA